MSRRRSRTVIAVVASLILLGSLCYAHLRMPRYHFAAPHQGYLASGVAEYDLLVPDHSRLFSRALNYFAPSVQACTIPNCNGWESKQNGPCPANINCTNYICKDTHAKHVVCLSQRVYPPCQACVNTYTAGCTGPGS